jgi:urease accessory protein
MRGDKPFVFTNLKKSIGVEEIIDFIVSEGML